MVICHFTSLESTWYKYLKLKMLKTPLNQNIHEILSQIFLKQNIPEILSGIFEFSHTSQKVRLEGGNWHHIASHFSSDSLSFHCSYTPIIL
ncbi:hypothetical protein HanXRQr2_Chr14g0631371 [Helianthus annuus]|uniref:Uncharacterized protein n=1 Tax=Helianthus annuus TaxID=4232 RepID=A0A251TVR2_HELAN|nr:hypothetical protein HanXRQr2_Chr14g0631371 [Helianthus annuus]KAJ0839335.1 hypothetical protein HanPSC8_Chr14g0605611 [Helianthus annuus]